MRTAICLVLCALLQCVAALKFQVEAKQKNAAPPTCIRDFVTRDTLVVVKMKASGYAGDGQSLTVTIRDNKNNEYGRKKDVIGDYSLAFTPHADAAFDVCFENVLTGRHNGQSMFRNVELDVEIGANARDWNAYQAAERLKPSEVELARLDGLMDDIRREQEYLRLREMRLRDTNESTNRRVKMFSIGIVLALLGLGVWQVSYLRAYFRSKHII